MDEVELLQAVAEDVPQMFSGMSKAAIGASIAVAALAGAAISYLVTTKVLKSKYEAILEEEISDVKRHYSIVRTEIKPDPEVLVGRRLVDDMNYRTEAGIIMVDGQEINVVSDDDMVARNLFDEHKPTSEWNYEIELAGRTEDEPYVIHIEEYENNEKEYAQITITYYDVDGVLCDDRDQHIPDTDHIVGEDNMEKFGHGTQDKDLVYIRNDKLDTEFEVIRVHGSYSEQILGVLEHSDRRRVPKFRLDE